MTVRRWQVGAAFALLAALALGVWWRLSPRRGAETQPARPRVVLSLPFGTTPDAVGRSVGLDGLAYGPLAFAVHGGTVAVADTYRGRVLWLDRGRPSGFRGLGDALLEDVVWSARDHGWLAVDNRNLAVWLVGPAGARRLVTVPEPRGTSRAIWHLWVDNRGDILLEVLTLGRGRLTTEFEEYGPDGRPAAQSEAVLKRLATREGPGTGVAARVESMALGPGGDFYVLTAGPDDRTRTVLCWRPDATLAGRVQVRFPRAVHQAVLLGVGRNGALFLGADLGGRQGLVEVTDAAGRVEHMVAVPPEPVRAAVYGRVTSDGSLYLVENTPDAYRLVRWTWRR
ncbi:MAG: hypothetical protein K6V97_11790 [Actinomycetia bacterium]|nr:hypothetical protein [Actinomycetes bacterium]